MHAHCPGGMEYTVHLRHNEMFITLFNTVKENYEVLEPEEKAH